MDAWRALTPEQRMAAGAAAALACTLLLPWYGKSYFVTVDGTPRAAGDSLSAFAVFSFVEAAVLLVAAGVLYLMWARGRRRGFHLPGGDGTVVTAAGVWSALLLTWRLFDRPDVDDPGATLGIEWGFMFAYAAAAALTAAGARLRVARVPEPPNPVDTPVMQPRRRRDPADAEAVTEVLRDPPSWEGEPPEAPRRGDRPRGAEPPEAPPPGRGRRSVEPKPPPPPDRLF